MKTRRFGATGPLLPVIGQGTWRLDEVDQNTAIATLRAGIDAGASHVDTAELYGEGAVEYLVGEAIRGRRSEVFLVSKVRASSATLMGTKRACERSLRRLGTDYLDLYLLHSRNVHPLEETIRAFESLVDEGKVRSYGVSNFYTDRLERAVAIAGEGRIACNQVRYNLHDRSAESILLPFCEARGMPIVAHSPFGSGTLVVDDAEQSVLGEIAKEHRATVHQVALAFLTRHPLVFAIPRTTRLSHVHDNVAAASIALRDAEIRRIEDAFRRVAS